jgi:hypothetical protein
MACKCFMRFMGNKCAQLPNITASFECFFSSNEKEIYIRCASLHSTDKHCFHWPLSRLWFVSFTIEIVAKKMKFISCPISYQWWQLEMRCPQAIQSIWKRVMQSFYSNSMTVKNILTHVWRLADTHRLYEI